MIPFPKPLRQKCDAGVAWSSSGSDTIDLLGDPFGQRTFALHASGCDFHRGLDIHDNQPGAVAKSPVNGMIVRKNYSHFFFDDAENGAEHEEVDASSKATFTIDTASSRLRIVGKNNGTISFPSGVVWYRTTRPFSMYGAGAAVRDWMVDVNFQTAPSTSGKVGFMIYDSVNDEYVSIRYDGSTFTVNGKDAGGLFGVDDDTVSASGKTWVRIKFTASTGEIKWQYSTNNTGSESGGWTDIATEGTISWTRKGPGFKAGLIWDPAASASDDTVDIEFYGWWDGLGIGRFGNWVVVAREADAFVLMHMRHISAGMGEIRCGGAIGNTGKSGFDILSGRIQSVHTHIEYLPSPVHDYSNDLPINPLTAGILPRANTTVDIAVVRDTAMDPITGLVDCHRLTITVQRGSYNNFQIDEFRMQGNLATRTLKWSTRAGLDPADHDAASYDGFYFGPAEFDENSSALVFQLYASKAVIGPNWTAGYVKDTAGTTIWSG